MINFDPTKDRYSIHGDFAQDGDEAKTLVASLAIAKKYGATYDVVVGAYGTNTYFLPGAPAYADSILGPGNWLNAHSARAASAATLGARWLATLNAGGRVFIAEGGQLDFSLLTAQWVKARGGDVSRIFSIQHSDWNISKYGAGVLNAFTTLGANHVRISQNGSPDRADLEDNNAAVVSAFKTAAAKSAFALQWEKAYAFYTSPGVYNSAGGKGGVDFSDAVESLYIFDVPKSVVGNMVDFAREFLPVAPVPPVGPTTLTYEAERLEVITGYRVENIASASGGKALSFVGGSTNEKGSGALVFGDTPDEITGQYRLSLRCFDENDGIGQIRVSHRDVETGVTSIFGTVTLNRASGSANAQASTLFTSTLPGTLSLTSGDRLIFEGTENLSEHARLDLITLTPQF